MFADLDVVHFVVIVFMWMFIKVKNLSYSICVLFYNNLIKSAFNLFTINDAFIYITGSGVEEIEDDDNNEGTLDATTNTLNSNNNFNDEPQLAEPTVILYPRKRIRIGFNNPHRHWYIGAGLVNIGNTCYLNSTLQALMHVPSLVNWLDEEYREGHLLSCMLEICCICSMILTLQQVQLHKGPVSPVHITSRIENVCKEMILGCQEDAHEFLRFLINAMDKSFLTRFPNIEELNQLEKETSPLSQIFGGYLKSSVRCLSCGHNSVTYQFFQDLSLEINKVENVKQALDLYFARERLEDMCYKCENCQQNVYATKQFLLERAPITLCLQLKRFNVPGTKLSKPITIKKYLDLSKYFAHSEFNGEPLKYKLVATITHLGDSSGYGHYTAIGLTQLGTYYTFDDANVRCVGSTVRDKNAYILFYEMKKKTAQAQKLQF